MIDLIRQSQVPANVVRSASRGALALPPAEMIEILVYLTASPIFGEQARMTLAGWDEASALAACSDPAAPREVLDYFFSPKNRRPRLLPALIENPAIPDEALMQLAQEPSREVIDAMLASPRVTKSVPVLQAIATNPRLTQQEVDKLQQSLGALGQQLTGTVHEFEDEELVMQYFAEHADEIAAEEGKAFEMVDSTTEEQQAASEKALAEMKPEERERLSTVQKIARLSVGERVQLAMKGNKDERFVLIRDGSKVVSSAVLESPKLSEQEVETFASMKNVQESVLRGIAGKRKFMKTYSVVRNLVNNPRCPLDVQLNLIKQLLTNDLKAASMNKNISETVRKMALKMFKDRTERRGGGGE
jgi:hypothetical protein